MASAKTRTRTDTTLPRHPIPPEHVIFKTASDNAVMLSRGYNLTHKLGSGSYSKVRLAVNNTTRKRVAVKIIDRLRASRDYLEDFLPRELSIVCQLRHPNVLRTYEWFEQNHKVFMILEFAESGDVLEYVRTVSKGPIPEVLARKWSLQTARALHFMHDKGVAHRDVKCENLLLDTGFNIKLSDFGFARPIGKKHLSNTFCGSAAYAAPEIIRSTRYSPYKSDVWALGVVIYILMTGTMPFGEDVKNIRKIMQIQCSGACFDNIVRDECRDLIRGMLTVTTDRRLTLREVLESEWLNQVQLS